METSEALQVIKSATQQMKQLLSSKAPVLLKLLQRKVQGVEDDQKEFETALVELYELIAEIEEEIVSDCSIESQSIEAAIIESQSIEAAITENNVPVWAPPENVQDFVDILKETAEICKTNTSKHGDIKKAKAVKIHEAHEITKDVKSLVKPIVVKEKETTPTTTTTEIKKELKKP